MKKWGLKSWLLISQEMPQLVNQKGGVLHNAWFGHIGHKRPEIADGLSLEAAQKNAAEIDQQLQLLILETR